MPATVIVLHSAAPVTDSGQVVVGVIEAPAANMPKAYLVVDPIGDRIALVAPCGCQVHHTLSSLIEGLVHTLAKGHDQAADNPGAFLTPLH